jgi:hypothetical protein
MKALPVFLLLSTMVLTVFLFACQKDDDWEGTTTLYGQVIDVTTGQAVADATVSLGIQTNISATYRLIGEVQTDSNGYFALSFTPEPNRLYELKGYQDNSYQADQAVHMVGYANQRTLRNLRLYVRPIQ